jgi:hypothetical protein
MSSVSALSLSGAHGIRLAALSIGAFVSFSEMAAAVPAFAVQTGQPCASCHVGGFGPQLTQFGREFKMNGYTMRAVGQWDAAPVSMMAVASYIRTLRDQESAPAAHYSTNNNLTLDQASVFLAGGFGQHFGAFVQATYDGVGRSFSWDNLDLRAVTTTTVFGSNAVIGVSLNNSPTVTDPWNTLSAWGYPYTSSAVAPSPSAGPQIAGAFAQNVLGLNGYVWWNGAVYSELGFYWSPDASFLNAMGVAPDQTNQIDGAAPYFRLAYQHGAGDHSFEVGGFGFVSDVYPGRDHSAGTTDRYRDWGADASYELTGASGDTWTLNARYTYERQLLGASAVLGLAANGNNTLNDLRADLSYYSHQGLGASAGVFDTWGSSDALLYGDSRTNSPNSSGIMLQADFTPFGRGHSPFGPRFNARLGVQYVYYAEFNGARRNYDGAGRNAADNNTLRIFAWAAY